MYPRIRNCSFKFKCPLSWDDLQTTADPAVRHCTKCERQVHFCRDDQELLVHARRGDCVAKLAPSDDELPHLMLGEPSLADLERTGSGDPVKRENQRISGVEADKDEALANMKYSSRPCPDCGFPVACFWKACRVCGLEIGLDRKHL